MKKFFIGCYNKSVILTYLGAGFSVFGMLYLINTIQSESTNRFDVSMICLIVAGICHLFDGFIARKFFCKKCFKFEICCAILY